VVERNERNVPVKRVNIKYNSILLSYEIHTNGISKQRSLSVKLVKDDKDGKEEEYGHFTMSGHAQRMKVLC